MTATHTLAKVSINKLISSSENDVLELLSKSKLLKADDDPD